MRFLPVCKKAAARRPRGIPPPARLFPILFRAGTAAFLLVSCATVDHHVPVDGAVDREEFTQAAAVLESQKKTIYRENDNVLYCLDKGMLNHYAGNYELSSASLEEGERAIEKNFAVSVSQEIGVFLVNEKAREYDGEDYEDVYLNVFNALNYYHRGEIDEALVEIRRINGKLRNLSVKYGAVMSAMQKAALENNVEIPKNPQASVKFDNSALARYLGMLFYRGQGAMDDARIDRDQIKIAFADAPAVYTQGLPSSIGAELEIPPGMARLNVIAFAGRAPIKTEEVLRIPVGFNWIKIALPVMKARPSAVTAVELVLDGGKRFSLELLENMGAVAETTFAQKKAVIYTRSIIRASVKGVSAMVFDIMSETSEDNSALFGLLSLGSQIFAEASEQADLRMSRYFPEKAYVGGLNVPPGVYSFTVHFYSKSGTIVSRRFENVPVNQGVLNLTEAVCLK
ncbi:MAG: hypothetical protein LBQ44_02730 [Treponema sp.]|jgi:hypothetical protein|nr:hypothetical protein [Treponema sp.]